VLYTDVGHLVTDTRQLVCTATDASLLTAPDWGCTRRWYVKI